jgi:predicted metalloprotease
MQWRGRRQSSNVNDQRGRGGVGGMAFKGGIGTIAVVLVISLITGTNPLRLLEQMQTGTTTSEQNVDWKPTAEEAELGQFVGVVLADTEDVWNKLVEDYREPTLVMFSGGVESACGTASSSTGPFYCPEDEKVYIDLSFYEDLKNRFEAPGDFAQAYVIAHEVGHHVQHLMGITDRVHASRQSVSEEEYNKLSVRLELQADFLAGVWANHANNLSKILEPGDIDEALNAASAIGDDRLQRQTQGQVVPDSFTHGTSEQRMRWFKKGFETGDVSQGDTFNATSL